MVRPTTFNYNGPLWDYNILQIGLYNVKVNMTIGYAARGLQNGKLG
jgi:hypothetical protein